MCGGTIGKCVKGTIRAECDTICEASKSQWPQLPLVVAHLREHCLRAVRLLSLSRRCAPAAAVAALQSEASKRCPMP